MVMSLLGSKNVKEKGFLALMVNQKLMSLLGFYYAGLEEMELIMEMDMSLSTKEI